MTIAGIVGKKVDGKLENLYLGFLAFLGTHEMSDTEFKVSTSNACLVSDSRLHALFTKNLNLREI